MAHHDMLFANASSLFSASTAGDLYVVPSLLQERGYRNTGGVGQFAGRRGSGLWRAPSLVQVAALVAEAQKDPFISVGDLKAATDFLGRKSTVISRLKEAGFRTRHAAVKELLTDEHQLYRLEFAEVSVDCQWDRVIFCDVSTFSSANEGASFSLQTSGRTLKLTVYLGMSLSKRGGCVSVLCCGWISHELIRLQHRLDGLLDGLQSKQIFAKRPGVLCKNALSRWNNPVPPRQLLHSLFSYCFRGRPTSKSLTGNHKVLI